MPLFYFLTRLPLWQLIGLLVITPTVLAVGAQILLRWRVGFKVLAQNNLVGGFKFGIVGTIYAVLFAFTVIAVWEKFDAGETAVEREVVAASAVFRYAQGNEPEVVAVRAKLADYIRLVIDRDWPAMAVGAESRDASRALAAVYEAAITLGHAGRLDGAAISEVFTQLDNLTSARRVRLQLATGLVPDLISYALLGGALATVAFTLFFGSENVVGQIAMTVLLSLTVMMGVAIVAALNYPFTPPIYVHPDPLVQMLAQQEMR